MSSENNPLVGATEGLSLAILDKGEDYIKQLAQKFLNRELAFINKPENIDLVKEQRKSGEWNLIKQYIKNKDLIVPIQMGMALRKLESNPRELQELKRNIVLKYKPKGLHIAELVQNNILTELIGSVVGSGSSSEGIIAEVEELLLNIEKYTVFIKSENTKEEKIQEIRIKLQASSPDVLIIFGRGLVIDKCNEIKSELENNLPGYAIETKLKKDYILIFILKKY